jgi:drug/metabolite transporter (DMT)-like permease
MEGLALGSALLSALSNVIITPVAKDQRPVCLLTLRCGFAILFILASSPLWVSTENLSSITLSGISIMLFISGPAFALGVLIFYHGIATFGLARVFPIVNIFPLFTTLLGTVILGERPLLSILAGTVIIIAGVSLIAIDRDQSLQIAPEPSAIPGYLSLAAVVSAPLLFAVSTTAAKMVLNRGVSPMLINLGRMSCAAVISLAVSAIQNGSSGVKLLPRHLWRRIAVSSLLGDGIGHYMYFTAMRMGQVSTVVPLASAAPLFVVPLAHFVLKEPITARMALGTLLTVLGLMLVVSM